jgi:hypothetical protein
MNFETIYQLSVVLTKSQLRGTQRRKLSARWFSNPLVIIIVDAILIGALGTGGYFLTSKVPTDLVATVEQLDLQALIGIPTITTFMMILFGILSELSQPIQSTSTDLVNWLPISPTEFVVGSTISVSYTYSFLPSFFLAIALGPALYFGHGPIFVASAAMALVSLLIGSSAVELLRTMTNRISSSFYRKSGRSGIFLRLGLTILLLVCFQLLFSSRIVVSLLRGLTQTVNTVWYVPVVWPSLAVQTLGGAATFTPVAFGLLSIGFMVSLFGLAVSLRRTYWVPVPVSIRLSSQPYEPGGRRLTIPGLDSAESAIVRKDMRSLLRRREMARFLAIPFVLAASMWVSAYPFGDKSNSPLGFAVAIPLYLVPVAIFCAILSMTSIGQEGSAIWNLYTAPLKANQLVRAKILLPSIMGAVFTVALLVGVSFVFKPATGLVFDLLLLGLIVVLEESALGICIGAKFPDFRETVRSRYVSVWGSLLGTLLALLIAVLTAAPLLLSEILPTSFQPTVVEIIIGFIVFACLWKVATRQVKLLMSEIRV